MELNVKADPLGQNGGVAERWTPERRRQHTRDVLLDAAVQVFARRGFEGASLEEIAEQAGYSRGAIYKNFGGKEELFLAVIRRVNERAMAHFAEVTEERGLKMNEASVAELAAEWRRLFFQDADFDALALEFQLYVLRHPETQGKVAENSRRTVELVAQMFQHEADAAGVQLPYPAELLGRIFLAASDGFQNALRLEPDGPDLIQPFLELFMRSLAASPE